MSATTVIRKWAEAINGHDAASFSSLYAPNAVVNDPTYAQPLEGSDAIRKDMEEFLRAFPDLKVTVRSTLEEGNTYASEATFVGTHTGPLIADTIEVPATGKRIEMKGAGFVRLDGQGRILEENRYFDLAGLLAQLEVTV